MEKVKLKHLPRSAVDFNAIDQGRVIRFTFVPPGQKSEYYAAAAPVQLGHSTFGAIVVASLLGTVPWYAVLGQPGWGPSAPWPF